MRLLLRLFMACGIIGSLAGTSSAGVEDSRFEISPDGAKVTLELRDVPRRYALEKLLAGHGPKLEWSNREIGDELVSGNYMGSRSTVARQLLEPTDFILASRRVGDKTEIVRVIILGKAAANKVTSSEPASKLTLLERSFADDQPTPELGTPSLPPPIAIPNDELVPPMTPGGEAPVPGVNADSSDSVPTVGPATAEPPIPQLK